MGTKEEPDWLETRFVIAKTLHDPSYRRDQPVDRWDEGLEDYFNGPLAATLGAGEVFGACEHIEWPKLTGGVAQTTFTYEGGEITYTIADAKSCQQTGGPNLNGLIHAIVTVLTPELLAREAHQFWNAMLRPLDEKGQPYEAGRHIIECMYGMHSPMIAYQRNRTKLHGQSALEALEFPLGTVAIQTASGYEERQFHK